MEYFWNVTVEATPSLPGAPIARALEGSVLTLSAIVCDGLPPSAAAKAGPAFRRYVVKMNEVPEPSER